MMGHLLGSQSGSSLAGVGPWPPWHPHLRRALIRLRLSPSQDATSGFYTLTAGVIITCTCNSPKSPNEARLAPGEGFPCIFTSAANLQTARFTSDLACPAIRRGQQAATDWTPPLPVAHCTTVSPTSRQEPFPRSPPGFPPRSCRLRAEGTPLPMRRGNKVAPVPPQEPSCRYSHRLTKSPIHTTSLSCYLPCSARGSFPRLGSPIFSTAPEPLGPRS